jgi:predicted RNA binding protein YcfA (HicA-like mRNA interferase family)
MPPRVPVLKAKEIIRALQRAGFFIHHTVGSHAQLKHSAKPKLRITVPQHSGDVPPTILRSILKQAELSIEEFLDLL